MSSDALSHDSVVERPRIRCDRHPSMILPQWTCTDSTPFNSRIDQSRTIDESLAHQKVIGDKWHPSLQLLSWTTTRIPNAALRRPAVVTNAWPIAALHLPPAEHGSSFKSVRARRLLLIPIRPVQLDSTDSWSQRPSKSYYAAWSLYVEELERLREALVALPLVTELAILPPSGSQSKLLRGLYLALLGLIARDCPGLRQLSIDDDEEILRIVPELEGIPHVVFLRGSVLSVGPGVIPDEPGDEESNESVYRGFRSQCRKRKRQLRDGIVKRIKLEGC
ncbi:hypothetical protein EJ03DRAFT_36868 [Teratosphaeria nubilosa]|uniref:Uncharacterized protein n=1 Tax=Teratosphaeria nubilosa TaxID=161662 RepID=A0A6G1LF70_9PEZI|nr:hypothetical protein EJ03DRAFT_36868 [Teratosphaeria nubilosa]